MFRPMSDDCYDYRVRLFDSFWFSRVRYLYKPQFLLKVPPLTHMARSSTSTTSCYFMNTSVFGFLGDYLLSYVYHLPTSISRLPFSIFSSFVFCLLYFISYHPIIRLTYSIFRLP